MIPTDHQTTHAETSRFVTAFGERSNNDYYRNETIESTIVFRHFLLLAIRAERKWPRSPDIPARSFHHIEGSTLLKSNGWLKHVTTSFRNDKTTVSLLRTIWSRTICHLADVSYVNIQPSLLLKRSPRTCPSPATSEHSKLSRIIRSSRHIPYDLIEISKFANINCYCSTHTSKVNCTQKAIQQSCSM